MLSKFLVAFLCCDVAFLIFFFCGCSGFFHRTESDLPFSLPILTDKSVFLLPIISANRLNVTDFEEIAYM